MGRSNNNNSATIPRFVRLIEMSPSKTDWGKRADCHNPPPNTIGMVVAVMQSPWGEMLAMEWTNGSTLNLLKEDRYVDIEYLVEVQVTDTGELDYTLYDKNLNHIDGGQVECFEYELVEDLAKDLHIPAEAIMTSSEFDFIEEYLADRKEKDMDTNIRAWNFSISKGRNLISCVRIKATEALARRLADNFAENDMLLRDAEIAGRWDHQFTQYRDQQYSIVSFPEGDICYRLVPAEN